MQYRIHESQISQTKMRAMRIMVDRLQDEAWREAISAGWADGLSPPPPRGVWARLRAEPGTLGHDYLQWSFRNWKSGYWKAGSVAALHGLMVAPRCGELWRMLTPPVASPRYWARRLASGLFR